MPTEAGYENEVEIDPTSLFHDFSARLFAFVLRAATVEGVTPHDYVLDLQLVDASSD